MTIDSGDDDRLREALRRDAPPPQASAALRELRPAMRRSRSHRHIAMGTATVVLLAAGSAGVLAVNAAFPGRDRRASTTLPTVSEPVSESTFTISVTTVELVPAPESPDSPADPVSSFSVEPDTTSPSIDNVPVETTATPTPAPEPTATGTVLTQPAPPPPQPTPAAASTVAPVAPTTIAPPPTTRTVGSTCGTVVIAIEGQRIHVDSLAPAPGFSSQISHDGPETVELVFLSSPTKCEIHVESRADGLHVEVQDDS